MAAARCDARARATSRGSSRAATGPERGVVPAARHRGRAAARRWLGVGRAARSRPPTTGPTRARSTSRSRASGLARLGLPDALLQLFSNEFVARDDDRSTGRGPRRRRRQRARALGLGRAATGSIDALLLLYARDARRARARSRSTQRLLVASGVGSLRHSSTRPNLDGLRAVRLPRRDLAAVRRGAGEDGARRRRPSAPASSSSATRTSTGLYTDRARRCLERGLGRRPRPQRQLPRLPPAAAGRAPGSGASSTRHAPSRRQQRPAARLRLAAKMVGRWPGGAPLALAPDARRPDASPTPTTSATTTSRPARHRAARSARTSAARTRATRSTRGRAPSDSLAINRRHRHPAARPRVRARR